MQEEKIIYISYNGALDPIMESQGLCYIYGLIEKGYKFILLTFERKERLSDIWLLNDKKNKLAGAGIDWQFLRYHKGGSILITGFDIISGVIRVLSIKRKSKIKFIHARSYVPAVIAWLVKVITGIPYIFDMRGFMAEERVDAGLLKNRGFKYRIIKIVEKILLEDADEIIVLTEKATSIIRARAEFFLREDRVSVIPCCVDTKRFKSIDATVLRDKEGLKERFVLVYAGSIGTWYLAEEMVDFFKVLKKKLPQAFFLLLLNNDVLYMDKLLRSKGIIGQDYKIMHLNPEEVSLYLNIADAGLFFIMPTFSKQFSSPIKFGEYLSCGLPVITNSGVGDIDIQLKPFAGIFLKGFSRQDYEKAVDMLLESRRFFDKRKIREYVKKILSLEIGVEKYAQVYLEMGKKRILVIASLAKKISPSMRYRMEQWMPHLKSRGFRFNYISFSNEYLQRLLLKKGYVLKKSAAIIFAYLGIVLKLLKPGIEKIVFLHREATRIGPPIIEWYFKIINKTIVFDFDDAIFLPSAGSCNGIWGRLRCRWKTGIICRLSSQIIVGNRYLLDYAKRFNDQVSIIPSTVEISRYHLKQHTQKDFVTLGWIGSHTTMLECLPLLKDVFIKLKEKINFKLLIIGPETKFVDLGIEYELVKWNADTEEEDLLLMDIGLMPLEDNLWQAKKCGMKILQYMAVGIPVVASPVGVNKDIIQDGENGFLAIKGEDWIDKILMLSRDDRLREHLGMAGRMLVEEKYSSECGANMVAAVLNKI